MPDDSRQPLTGIRILDLTRVLSGPFCTMILGDLGADVIKIEPPEGDSVRGQGAGRDGLSWYFASFNRNKRSLVLDLKTADGKVALEKLIAGADAIVENFRPGVLDRLGFPDAKLQELRPGIIRASISGFGPDGPYRDRPAFDFIAQAMSGFMSTNGRAGDPPLRTGIPVSDLVAGIYTALGVTAALLGRERGSATTDPRGSATTDPRGSATTDPRGSATTDPRGSATTDPRGSATTDPRGSATTDPRGSATTGERVDVSLTSSMISLLAYLASNHFATGELPVRTGNDHPIAAPYGLFRTGDGEIAIAPNDDVFFGRLMDALEMAHLKSDPELASNPLRIKHRARLNAEVEKRLATNTSAYWIAQLNAAGVPCGFVHTLRSVFEDPQVHSQQMAIDIPHPGHGTVRMLGFPMRFANGGCTARRPAPDLGQHSREILSALAQGGDPWTVARG